MPRAGPIRPRRRCRIDRLRRAGRQAPLAAPGAFRRAHRIVHALSRRFAPDIPGPRLTDRILSLDPGEGTGEDAAWGPSPDRTRALVDPLGAPFVILPLVNPDNAQHGADENPRIGNTVDGVRALIGLLLEPF